MNKQHTTAVVTDPAKQAFNDLEKSQTPPHEGRFVAEFWFRLGAKWAQGKLQDNNPMSEIERNPDLLLLKGIEIASEAGHAYVRLEHLLTLVIDSPDHLLHRELARIGRLEAFTAELQDFMRKIPRNHIGSAVATAETLRVFNAVCAGSNLVMAIYSDPTAGWSKNLLDRHLPESSRSRL